MPSVRIAAVELSVLASAQMEDLALEQSAVLVPADLFHVLICQPNVPAVPAAAISQYFHVRRPVAPAVAVVVVEIP